ncbi:MAG: Asp/Glu/hydantoin racemase [Gammaproteobacteria bacterium]|nr:Asp/Glu/hydantoin racemase [Gammaproteobacteria bacterium]
MTPKKLALLHTSPVLTPLFASLCMKWMPQTRIFHMVDESLIKNTIEAAATDFAELDDTLDARRELLTQLGSFPRNADERTR